MEGNPNQSSKNVAEELARLSLVLRRPEFTILH
jgi:hypothetical protein